MLLNTVNNKMAMCNNCVENGIITITHTTYAKPSDNYNTSITEQKRPHDLMREISGCITQRIERFRNIFTRKWATNVFYTGCI